MNARATQAGHPPRPHLQPPTLDDTPVTEAPCPDDDRCPSVHPRCPQMRCQRHIHRKDIACTASGRGPWWSCFWVGGIDS